jgi:hypothetical protein
MFRNATKNRQATYSRWQVERALKMKITTAQINAFWQFSLKAYLILSVSMFVGGIVVGGAFALAGYAIPNPF